MRCGPNLQVRRDAATPARRFLDRKLYTLIFANMDQSAPPRQRTRRITIVALDPSFRVKRGGRKRILTTEIEVPAKVLAPGPSGYRVQATNRML